MSAHVHNANKPRSAAPGHVQNGVNVQHGVTFTKRQRLITPSPKTYCLSICDNELAFFNQYGGLLSKHWLTSGVLLSDRMSQKQTVIIDLGCSLIKAGFMGEAVPRATIRREGQKSISHIMSHDEVVDILHTIFRDRLLISAKGRSIVVAESWGASITAVEFLLVLCYWCLK